MRALISLYKRAYSKKYIKYAIVAIIFMIIDVAIGLSIPFFSNRIVRIGLNNKDLGYVTTNGLIIIGLALLTVIFTVVNNIFAQYLGQSIGADIRNDLFKKVQKLSFSNIDQITTGKLITVITNDTNQIQQVITMSFRIILRAPLVLIGAIIMSYLTNQDLFIIIMITVPVLALGFIVILSIAAPHFMRLQQRMDELNTKLLESIEGAREIKTFLTMDQDLEKFNEVNENYHKTLVRVHKIMSMLNPHITLITNIAFGAILYLGAYYANIYGNIGNLDMKADVMAYIAYIMNIIFGLSMLSMVMMFLTRASISARRIDLVFKTEVDIKNNDDPIIREIEGNIEFRNVDFYYNSPSNGEGKTLSNISFKVKKGTTIGIIGSTGSGKTTLVQLIPRLYDVTNGEVLIDGINVKDYDLETLRRQVSFVTQEAIVFAGTIRSNILQGKEDATDEELQEAAEYAVADEYINRFEKGFDTPVTQEGTSLSGGQRQRLSLARAFVRKPKILILDDSTSAVDAKSEEKIKNNIKKLRGKMTTLIVAQKISSIRDCDAILVLNNKGQVDGYGPHEQLLKTSKVYQEIYISQFGGELNE